MTRQEVNRRLHRRASSIASSVPISNTSQRSGAPMMSSDGVTHLRGLLMLSKNEIPDGALVPPPQAGKIPKGRILLSSSGVGDSRRQEESGIGPRMKRPNFQRHTSKGPNRRSYTTYSLPAIAWHVIDQNRNSQPGLRSLAC